MPEDVIQAKTASVINNLLNRRFLPNRYKIEIVRERNGSIPTEQRKSFRGGKKAGTHKYFEETENLSDIHNENSTLGKQMYRQHSTPITESSQDSPNQTPMTPKRILPKKVEFDDLPDDMKHRAELSRRITIISQIQNEG